MGEIFYTVVVAVTILVVGQIIIKFVIEPIHEQKKVIGEIVDALDYYADVYFNLMLTSEERTQEASKRFRQLATTLKAKTHLIPRYTLLSQLGFVHGYKDMVEVCAKLSGLSNSCRKPRPGVSDKTEHCESYRKRIKEILGVL